MNFMGRDQGMKNYQRVRGSWLKATASALLPLMTATLPFSVPGWAGMNDNFNPNAVNVANLPKEKINCNEFCDSLVSGTADGGWGDKDDKKEYKNVQSTEAGRAGWSERDDQFCADHGYPTNPTVQSAVVTPSAEKCDVKMLSTDGSGQAACKKTSDAIYRCQFHNTQLIPQCLAYKATKDASDWELALAALDTAAAGTCAVACSGAVVSLGTSQTACTIAGTATTVAETAAVFTMNNGTVSKTIAGALTAIGAASTAVEGYHTVAGLKAGSRLKDAGNAADKAKDSADALRTQADGAQDLVKEGNLDASTAKEYADNADKADKGFESADSARKSAEAEKKQQQEKAKEAACVSAVTFAALAGVRYVHYGKYYNSRADACNTVQSLASNALSNKTGPAGNQGPGSSNGFNGINTAGGTVGGNGSGGGNGSSARGTDGDPVSQFCNAGVGCEVPPSLSAASDGGLLKESGLDKLVARPAGELAHSLANGVTPAQALQNALSGQGGGELGHGMASVAQAAQDDAASLGGKLQMGSPSGGMYTASGGAGGGRAGSDSNPFGNLFGGAGAGGGGARATASQVFGKSHVMDIYHTGTSQNLFEIVSGKMSSVAGRVGAR
jgi:hypothetical protein